LNGTLVSGEATSGRRGVNGLIKSRKRTVLVSISRDFYFSQGKLWIARFGDRVQHLHPLIVTVHFPGSFNGGKRRRNKAGLQTS